HPAEPLREPLVAARGPHRVTATPSSGAGAPPPRLYIITDRRHTAGRPLAAVVAQALGAVRSGRIPSTAVAVQLREKDLHGKDLFALASALRAVTRAARVRLFISDRLAVRLASRADAASARPCIDAGASGVALIRAVLSDGAPERALEGIFEAIGST